MKLAVIYTDKRGKFVSEGCAKFCDVIDYDLSNIQLSWWQRYLSALISYHSDRNIWMNDYDRNPAMVMFRKIVGDEFLRKKATKVDAVLQFGAMTLYDHTILGNPKFYIYHDGAYDPENLFWSSPRFGHSFCKRQTQWLQKADAIFTFSNWAKNQHINDYLIPGEKVFDVKWGPCLPIRDILVRERDYAKKFVFIGGEVIRKGIDILLEAFETVNKLHNDISLEIIGTTSDKFSDYDLRNIRFHGYCDAEEIINILSASDVFILPSRYERAGHATIEAMCYGLPVIVTDTCGLPEPVISGQCGHIIDVENINALSNAILSLINNPKQVSEFSENAIMEYKKNWTWDKVGSRIVSEIEASLR